MKIMWTAFIGLAIIGVPFIILAWQGKIWGRPRQNDVSESETETNRESRSASVDWGNMSNAAVLILALLAIGISVKIAFSEVGDTEIAAGITLRNRVSLYWLPLTLLGNALTIWLIQKGVSKSSESRWEGGGGGKNILAPFIGALFALLLIAASCYLLQAAATSQAERGLLASQGWRDPPREQRLRAIDSETTVVLEPGQLSNPIKVGGTQDVSFNPPTIPNSDVTKLFYYPYNGSYSIVTNRLWTKTTHSIGYEMRLKNESARQIRIEVAVGRL